MEQRDLFGEIVDTIEERNKAYKLDLEYTDLIGAMREDYDKGLFKPYLKEYKRELSDVDFLNLRGLSLLAVGSKNIDEVNKIYSNGGMYKDLFERYVKWKSQCDQS